MPVMQSASPFMQMAVQEDAATLKKNWLWFVVLGFILMMIGALALGHSCFFTVVGVIGFGYLMLVAGISMLIASFYTGGWGGFFLSVLDGLLNLAVGFILINHPAQAAAVFTLFMAVYFFVDGLFRIFTALSGQCRQWGWVLISGAVNFFLGIMIWQEWPFSGVWVIGLFLGVNLLLTGWTYIAVGLAARKLPEATA